MTLPQTTAEAVEDLAARAQIALVNAAEFAADTDVAFSLDDLVNRVINTLPEGYYDFPERRDIIEEAFVLLLSGVPVGDPT